MEEFFEEVKGLKGAKLRKTMEALGHRARQGEQHQDEWDFGKPRPCRGHTGSGLRLARSRVGTEGVGGGAQGTGALVSNLR